jgi:hypothetical protein
MPPLLNTIRDVYGNEVLPETGETSTGTIRQ